MPPRTAKKNPVTSAVKKTPAKSPVKSKPPPSSEVENITEPTDTADPSAKAASAVEDESVQEDARKEEERNQAAEAEAAGAAEASESNGADAEKGDEDNKDERLELDDNEPEPDYEEDGDEPLKDEADIADVKVNGSGEGVEGEEEQEDVDEDKQNGGEEEGDLQEGEDEGLEEEDVEGEGEEIEGEGDEEEDGGGEGEGEGEGEDIPAPLKERQKQKEFEIFVGGLDKEATEEDLKKVFSEVGEVKEVRMTKNPVTQKNRGFAFVQFATVEQAKRALTELKNPQVRDKRCGVSPSQDNDTLYLGNICKTWTKDAVRDKLKSYGVENIEQLALADDPKNEGTNRGFAFLEFTTHLDAMNAYKRLQKKDAVFGCDRSAKVAFAESSIQPDEVVMAQVKTVFVDGLPPSWDEERVKEEFNKYGEIEKVQLARNMSSAKRKDYGFVIFSSRDSALACVEGINNSELGEGDNKIKANLAKPQHKGRLVKQGVRGGYKIGQGGGKGGKAARGRKPGRFQSKGAGVRDGKSVAGRGGQNRGLKLRRQSSGRIVADKRLPSPKRTRDRQPIAIRRIRSRRDYGRRDEPFYDSEVRSLSRSALDFATHVAASRRSSLGIRGPSRSAAVGLPYPEDSYARRFDRVPSYPDMPGRPYDAVSGTKRSYAAVDDVPRYGDPALRHTRARLDYDVSAGAPLYRESSYGQSTRLARGRSSVIGQQSYDLYDTHQSAAGYGGSSVGGRRVGGLYPSGYGADSLSGRADIGASYSSLYTSRNLSGGYLLGRSSGSYY